MVDVREKFFERVGMTMGCSLRDDIRPYIPLAELDAVRKGMLYLSKPSAPVMLELVALHWIKVGE